MNLTISAGHNVAFMIQRLGWPWSMLDSEEFQKVERQFIISTTAARSDTFPSYHQYNKWCRRRHNIRHLQFREQCPLCGEQFHLTDGHLTRESVSGQNWLVFIIRNRLMTSFSARRCSCTPWTCQADIGLGFSRGYEIWVFDSGTFSLAGDGGIRRVLFPTGLWCRFHAKLTKAIKNMNK